MRLMHRLRIALNVFNGVRAYNQAHAYSSSKALEGWYARNGSVVELMQYIWKLQGSITDE